MVPGGALADEARCGRRQRRGGEETQTSRSKTARQGRGDTGTQTETNDDDTTRGR